MGIGRFLAHSSSVPSGKHRWRWWTRLGTVIASFMLAIEISLRLIFGLGSPLLYQQDVACGYLPQPDQNINRFFAHNQINHFSMRSPDIDVHRAAGHERVLLLGDSVLYGTTYVDQSAIFSSLLANLLPSIEHKPVDVLNASAGGWGIANEVGYLTTRGTFDANLVLIVLNTTDPSQPMSQFEPGMNFPQSRPWSAIGEAWSHYVFPRLVHRALPGDAGTSVPEKEDATATILDNLRLLKQAQLFCKKSGAIFGVVYVPFVGWKGDFAERAHAEIVTWTADEGALLFDTAPVLSGENPAAVTFDGMHLRPRGHELVAKEIMRTWGQVDAAMAQQQSQRTDSK